MHLQLSFHLQCAYLVSDAEVRLKREKKREGEREKLKRREPLR